MSRQPPIPHEPPRLVVRFAVCAGAAVLLAAVGALLLARFNAESTARSELADDAAYLADELGRDDLVQDAFDGRVSIENEALLDDFLGRTASARDVTRTSLVAPDGTITYSTDHAVAGRPAGELGGGMLAQEAPVRWVLEAGRSRGTLVAERDDATVAADVRRAFLTQAGFVVLALLVLYAALIPVFRRVTAELEARHRRLAESEARYRSLMEQASDAIFVADDHGRLTEVNERACELLGYDRDELLRKHAMDLMSIGDVAQLPLHMRDLRAGKTILVERPVRRSDGTFLVGDVSAKILDDGRILTSIRDVTERKRLREAQRLEAVGRFAGGVADEFGSLLDSLADGATRLRARLPGDPDVDELRRTLDAARALTAQLLAVGSRQELSPEVVDLNDAVEGMRDLVRELVGDGVAVELRAGADVPPVLADPAQLERIVVDLVLHARREMAGDGRLTIETAGVERPQNGRVRARQAMLSIGDSGGAGGDDGGERLGLGLAAVFGVVHQSGGSIDVESDPDAGTTVRIFLPAAEVAAPVGAG